MGTSRPKLSKILAQRPDLFVLIRNGLASEPIVSLSPQARLDGRGEQLLHLKTGSDRAAAEVARQVGQRRGAPSLSYDEAVYQEACNRLVEMGFARNRAMQALVANRGDVVEAMDQLSSASAVFDAEGGAGGDGDEPTESPSPRRRAPDTAASRKPKGGARGAGGAGEAVSKGAKAVETTEQSEEEQLQKIIALSQREEEELRRHEDDALKAALAASMEFSRPSVPSCGAGREGVKAEEEDDDILCGVLEESRRTQAEEQNRREREEQEDLEKALQASLRLVRFHDTMDEDLQGALLASLPGTSSQAVERLAEEPDESAEWSALQEEIRQAYEEADEGGEADFDEVVLWRGQRGPLLHRAEDLGSISEEHAGEGKDECGHQEDAPGGSADGKVAGSSLAVNGVGAGSSSGGGGGRVISTLEWLSGGAGLASSSSGCATGKTTCATSKTTSSAAPSTTSGGSSASSGCTSGRTVSAPSTHSGSSSSSGCTSGRADSSARLPCSGGRGNSADAAAPAAGFSLRDWTLEVVDSLELGFEPELVWTALSEIQEDEQQKDETLKMWLGIDPQDELPGPLRELAAEHFERRQLMRFSYD